MDLSRLFIAGNHLATYRTGKWPHHDTPSADALEIIGAGRDYDTWVVWSAIMQLRDENEDDA